MDLWSIFLIAFGVFLIFYYCWHYRRKCKMKKVRSWPVITASLATSLTFILLGGIRTTEMLKFLPVIPMHIVNVIACVAFLIVHLRETKKANQ